MTPMMMTTLAIALVLVAGTAIHPLCAAPAPVRNR
jgi:hypothetical protein